MNDKYDAELDSPDARANFATRHIFNIRTRKKQRDVLLEAFRKETVVAMFPRRTAGTEREKLVTLTVDYGYDIHSVVISETDWHAIQAGEKLTIAGSGFCVEGKKEDDFWKFNHQSPGDLYVCCEGGREIYQGAVADLEVRMIGGRGG